MTKHFRQIALSLALLLGMTGTALAQAPAGNGWTFSIYPVLAWIPTSIDIETNLPPSEDGGGGGGSDPIGGGEIVDKRFDGAYLGGFSATNGTVRFDGDVVWAAVGGDRVELPKLTVDVDLVYFHASGGYNIGGDVFVTGGVRRMALDYDIKLLDFPNFNRKPGVWDPVVGVGYHKVSNKYEVHGTFEGGGFGVGTEWEYAGSIRADWKPISHFGITAGYGLLTFKLEDTKLGKTLEATQTLHGPVVGIGLYF